MRSWFGVSWLGVSWLGVVLAVGCATEPAPACPEGVALTEADLPCACHGATIDALTCGDLQCDAGGIAVLDTAGTTAGCTAESTTGDDTAR